MRTQEEIIERFQERAEDDWFGFETNIYLMALTFESAKPFLKPDVAVSEWDGPISIAQVDEEAKEYKTFFLEKIEGERGLSVERAVMKYTAWKWILGHPDSDTFPGAFDGGDGGKYQRKAYDYLNAQIDNGDWDSMTEAANPGFIHAAKVIASAEVKLSYPIGALCEDF